MKGFIYLLKNDCLLSIKKRVFAFWKWETVNFLILFPGVFQVSDIFVNESAQHSEGYKQREESYREASVLPQGFAMKVPPASFWGDYTLSSPGIVVSL